MAASVNDRVRRRSVAGSHRRNRRGSSAVVVTVPPVDPGERSGGPKLSMATAFFLK